MQISSYISSLMLDHECVVVPGLGGFLANPEPSFIDHVAGKIHPPSKSITFNQALDLNDGLLISEVAKKGHLSYEESRQMVDNFVKEVNESLRRQEMVQLPQIGRLFLNIENKLEFIAEQTNFSKSHFGLPALNFYPILRNQSEYSQPVVAKPYIDRKPSRKMSLPKIGKTKVAIAASLLALALALPIGIRWMGDYNQNDSNVSQSSFGFGGTKESDENDKPQKSENKIEEPAPIVNNDLPVAMQLERAAEMSDDDDDKKEKKDKKSEEQFTEKENVTMMQDYLKNEEGAKEYIVMVGAFSTSENAKKLSKKILKDGFTPYSDTYKGMKRVGVRVACTNNALNKHLEIIKKKYNAKAWLFVN